MKRAVQFIRIHIFLGLLLILGILGSPLTFALPDIDLSLNPSVKNEYAQLSQQYDAKVADLQKQATAKGLSLQLAPLEQTGERLARSFSQLAAAKTEALRSRHNSTIRVLRRQMDIRFQILERTIARAPVVPPQIRTPNVSARDSGIQGTPADFLYYADSFEGGGTSNGNIFRQAGFSAARCNIDLNTLVQLRYRTTGVIVKVNDRPNCSKHPDIVDLTKTAFSTLAPLSKGRLKGSFVPLGKVSNNIVKEYLPMNYFANLGIEIDPGIPNLYLPNETLRLTGKTNNGEKESLVYIVTPSGKIISYGQEAMVDTRFEYLVPLEEVGEYNFVLASGRSFSGAKSYTFFVLDPALLGQKQYFLEAPSTPVTPKTERREAGDLTPTHVVTFPEIPKNSFVSLQLKNSEGKTLSRTGMEKIAFNAKELAIFSEGMAEVRVTSRSSSTAYSLDTLSESGELFSQNMLLTPLYKTEKSIPFTVTTEGAEVRLTLQKESTEPIEGTAYVITPDGTVDEVVFDESFLHANGNLRTTQGATLRYTMRKVGTYLIEVNFWTGFAAVITPVSYGNVLPILPNAYDFASRTIETRSQSVIDATLTSLNSLRSKAGLKPLVLDPTLSKLALFKAKDMADHNYVGHQDSQGGYILETAERAGISLRGSVGENVAGWTVSASFLQAGLELSGAHRANMMSADWTKVGIGVVIQKGNVSLVQVFGQ